MRENLISFMTLFQLRRSRSSSVNIVTTLQP